MDFNNIPLATIKSSDDKGKDFIVEMTTRPSETKKKVPFSEDLREIPSLPNEEEANATDPQASEVADENGEGFEAEKISSWIWVLSAVAGISGLLFGYDTGVISGALAVLGSDLGHVLSSGQKELITSATSFAALISATTSGWLADWVGRKRLLLCADAIFVIGSVIMAASRNVAMMVVGRFIVGYGIGLTSLIVPMYITELAPARLRGRLVIIYVVFITGGQLIAYSLNAAFEHVHQGWRIMFGIGAAPALGQLISLFWTPESPRYLLRHNHVEKVYKILSRIHPEAKPAEIAYKVSLIQEGVKVDFPEGNKFQHFFHSLKVLFTVPSNRRSLFIGCFLQWFQQFSGTNAIQYFSAIIFQSVGFKNSISVSIVVGATNFVFTIVAFMFIDRIGRRRILLCTSAVMIAGLALCAIAYHFLPADTTQNTNSGWQYVVLASIIIFLASYASGIGNIPWQQAELFPMEVRALGAGFSTAINWVGNLIISASFLTMMESITPTGTFALFAGFCFVGLVTSYFTYPELAGMSIENIHKLLEKGFWQAVKESTKRVRKGRIDEA
ncbi:MFS myo-inositol transporter [Schizosaccharomyces pombe]